jgi:plastocyanin
MLSHPSINRLMLPAALSAAMLLSAACGQAQPTTAGGGSATEVRLATSEWKFAPDTLKVPVGKPVTLVLENKGMIEHDVKADVLGVHVHANPRQTSRQTLTFDKPGTYDYECSIPGHKEAGMKGKIVVGS